MGRLTYEVQQPENRGVAPYGRGREYIIYDLPYRADFSVHSVLSRETPPYHTGRPP